MNLLHLEILIIASLAAIACALPGTLLVLRGAALMSDAISHSVLLGIAVMFLFVQRLDSPLLLVGAALSGLGAVMVVEKIIASQKLKKDAALGLVFPLFFSLGVIIISSYAKNAHLDTDMVLLGELAFAPFTRLTIGSVDCGPYAVWILVTALVINMLMVWVLYKEWHATLFDSQYAHLVGFSCGIMHYLLMTIASVSAVATFNIVGSMVVVALMIIPAATASLCAKNFKEMILLSCGFGVASAWGGYACAILLNSSIAGCIAMVAGFLLGIVLLASPGNGIVSRFFQHYRTRQHDAQNIVKLMLVGNDNKPLSSEYIAQQLGWSLWYTRRVLSCLDKKKS
jgi:manganese/zinc/iron transport system permease protein